MSACSLALIPCSWGVGLEALVAASAAFWRVSVLCGVKITYLKWHSLSGERALLLLALHNFWELRSFAV